MVLIYWEKNITNKIQKLVECKGKWIKLNVRQISIAYSYAVLAEYRTKSKLANRLKMTQNSIILKQCF